jgi:hypothetical protein
MRSAQVVCMKVMREGLDSTGGEFSWNLEAAISGFVSIFFSMNIPAWNDFLMKPPVISTYTN